MRVSGAGLGCPDWPKCFGRWFPPTHISQLPPEIDPATFNMTLAWIEYFNRVGGVLLGLLLIALVAGAIAWMRDRREIMIMSIASLVLVSVQGWLGSVVVATELEPFIVSVHMLLALLLAGLLISIAHRSLRLVDSPNRRPALRIPWLEPGLLFLWSVALVQIFLGTQVREELELIQRSEPLARGIELLAQAGPTKHFHTIAGLALFFGSLAIHMLILARRTVATRLLRGTAIGATLLVTLQLMLGLSFISLGTSPMLQLLHVWLASMYVGVVLLMHRETRDPGLA